MSQQQITDKSRTLAYFALMPNIADDQLNPYEYRLYGHYLRVCGSYGQNQCTEGTRRTAATTQMSLGSVSKYRKALADKGYIRLTARDDDTVVIEIADKWPENMQRYSRSSGEQARPKDDDSRSSGEQERSSGERKNNKPNNINTKLSKDNLLPRGGSDGQADDEGTQEIVSFDDKSIFENLTRRALLLDTIAERLDATQNASFLKLKAYLDDMVARGLVEKLPGATGYLYKLSEKGIKAKYKKADKDIESGKAHKKASAYLQIYHHRLTSVHGASTSLDTIRRDAYKDARAIADHALDITAGEFAKALDNWLADDWYQENKKFISMRAISVNIHNRVQEMREEAAQANDDTLGGLISHDVGSTPRFKSVETLDNPLS